MTDRRDRPDRVDRRIDEALASWPDTERGPLDWDEAASRVVARVRTQLPAKTKTRIGDDELFEPPLPQGAEGSEGSLDPKSTSDDVRDRVSGSIPAPASGKVLEGGRMTMSSEQRQRERSSFKDLAKLAETPPPSSAGSVPSRKGDSGVVDLAQLAQSDPYAAQRAQTTPLARQGIFDDDVAGAAMPKPPSVPPPSMPSSGFAVGPASVPSPYSQPGAHPSSPYAVGQEPRISERMPASQPLSSPLSSPALASAPQLAPIAAAAVPAPVATFPSTAPAQKKSRAGLFIVGSFMALAAAAAGAFFFVKTKHPEYLHLGKAPTAVAAAPSAPAAATAAAPAEQPAPATQEAVAQADDTTPDEDTTAPAPAAKSTGKAHRTARRAAVAAKPEAPAAPAPAPEEKKSAAKDPKFAPTDTGADLRNAMEKAAPQDEVKQQTAAEKPKEMGNVPQKPATGAVTGAIGAVLPNARACLGPDDPISRATVEFDSSGSVKRVAVSGAAQGKPAEACIKAAFQHAKLQPFAEPSFTTTVTVRP